MEVRYITTSNGYLKDLTISGRFQVRRLLLSWTLKRENIYYLYELGTCRTRRLIHSRNNWLHLLLAVPLCTISKVLRAWRSQYESYITWRGGRYLRGRVTLITSPVDRCGCCCIYIHLYLTLPLPRLAAITAHHRYSLRTVLLPPAKGK